MTVPSSFSAALVVVSAMMLAGSVHPSSAQTSSASGAETGAAERSAPLAKPKATRLAGKPAASAKASAAKARKATARDKDAPPAPEPWMAVDPARAAGPAAAGMPAEPKSVVSHAGGHDPVEFGGKWNGNNDTAEKTRVENYNNDALGTGGALGLKLHF